MITAAADAGVDADRTGPASERTNDATGQRPDGRRLPQLHDRQIVSHTHTHTHTRLAALFSGTTRVSRYHKGKTNLDFTEAKDSEWQWHQLGHIQV